MAVENVIQEYRRRADALRNIKSAGRDADMDKYFNEQYAKIWDAAADLLEADSD